MNPSNDEKFFPERTEWKPFHMRKYKNTEERRVTFSDKVAQSEWHWQLRMFCSICGRDAKFNQPTRRVDTHEVVCYGCAHRSPPEGVLLYPIAQNTGLPSGISSSLLFYFLNGCGVSFDIERGRIGSGWDKKGRAFKFTEEEKEGLSILSAFETIKIETREGHYRCSSCSRPMKGEPAGFPLFCGVNCPECWEKHQEVVEEQGKEGRICSRCNEPYLLCCC